MSTNILDPNRNLSTSHCLIHIIINNSNWLNMLGEMLLRTMQDIILV